MFRKLSAFLLCMVLALSFTACADMAGGGTNAPTTPGEITVWTTYGTEKVVRNRDASQYESVKFDDNKLTVEACRGEHEAGQVIMTATADVSSFDVKISDLTSGSNTLEASNVDIYAEKYVSVTKYSGSQSGNNIYQRGLGDYPDALIPMAGYVAAGENKIVKGENQGIYVSFDVPLNQAPGEYTGKLTITYDGKTKDVDVKLTVYDLEVNKETHSKSYFNVWKTYYIGDLDTSQEMWDKYTQFLIDYRIAPSYVNRDGEKYNNAATDEETVKAYAQSAAYWVDKGMSTINSPWKAYATAQQTALTNLIVELAKLQLEKYQTECAKALEANPEAELDEVKITTYVDKIIVKGKDEPSYQKTALSTIAGDTEKFYTALENAVTKVDDLKKTLDAEDPNLRTYQTYIDAMKQEVKRIPELITEKDPLLGDKQDTSSSNPTKDATKKLTPTADNNKVTVEVDKKYVQKTIIDTVCPTFDVYGSQDKYNGKTYREALANWSEYNEKWAEWKVDKDKWWYGCNNPLAPYPTYHIEDPLVLARVLDWMMNEYGIVGNLYWAVTAWNPQTGDETYATDNYYEDNAIRSSNANGEGYLAYPGAPYGSSTPLPSMRLEAIRDGNEDYEILYNLNAAYKETDNVDFATQIQPALSDVLYSLAQVPDDKTSSANFDMLRRATIQLGLLVNSDAQFRLTGLEKTNRGANITAKFTWAEGATVKVNGTVVTGNDYDKEGRKQYSYPFALDKKENNFNIEVTTESGEKYVFDFGFGGQVMYKKGSALVSSDAPLAEFKPLDGKDSSTVTATAAGDGVKINLAAMTNSTQGLKLSSPTLFGTGIEKIVMYITTATTGDFQVRIKYKGGSSTGVSAYNKGLKASEENAVEIAIAEENPIDFLYLYTSTDEKVNPAAREFTINDIVVYYK